MKRDSIEGGMKSSKTYEVLEAIVREKAQEFIQDILEEDKTGSGDELEQS